MMKLDILEIARKDIWNIAQKHKTLVGVNSGKKITDKIRNYLGLLKNNPYLGKECTEYPLNDKNFRCLICGVYLCFYKIEENRIVVYRIIDGRTDYIRFF